MKTKKWIIAVAMVILAIPFYSFVMINGNGHHKNSNPADSSAYTCPYYNNANTNMMQGYGHNMMMTPQNGMSNANMQKHHAAMMQGNMVNGTHGSVNQMGHAMNRNMHQGMGYMNNGAMHDSANMHQIMPHSRMNGNNMPAPLMNNSGNRMNGPQK